jgi:hypothetical protein
VSETKLQSAVRTILAKRADNYLDTGDWEALSDALEEETGARTEWRTEDEREEAGGVTKYQVNWDNGGSACGTFPDVFNTRAEAQEFADVWAAERNLEDLGLTDEQVNECGGDGCYTAEVIETDGEVTR